MDFSDAELKDTDFRGITMEKVGFEWTIFVGATLVGARFDRATLEQVWFDGADLRDAQFNGAKLTDVAFDDTDLVNVSFVGAPLCDASFHGSRLTNVVFRGATLKLAEFEWATLVDVKFYGARLEKADFRAATLENVSFAADPMLDDLGLDPEATLVDVEFERTTAQRVSFERASLEDVRFRWAKLKGAIFLSTTLSNVDCRDATMERVDFRAEGLQAVKLSNADLAGADLRTRGLHFDDTKILHARLTARPASAARRWLDPLFIRSPKTDRWSELRRSYTGPNFIITLLFLVAFFLPLVLGAAAWRGIASMEDALLGLEMVCGAAPCPSYRVWQLLLGFHEGWTTVALTAVLLIYNGVRFYVTGAVSAYREEEERSGFTPAWQGRPRTGEEQEKDEDEQGAGHEAPGVWWRLQSALQGYEHLVWLHITLRFLAFIAVAAFLWRAWEVLRPVVHVVPS